MFGVSLGLTAGLQKLGKEDKENKVRCHVAYVKSLNFDFNNKRKSEAYSSNIMRTQFKINIYKKIANDAQQLT